MKNSRKGETCLIIGNGPSLANIPLKFLKKYASFGTNRIYLRRFTPTYYVAVNENIINQSMDAIKELDCPKFIRAELAHNFEDAYKLKGDGQPLFSKDPFEQLYEGFSVTYVCLQLAYWMGFKVALLIGVDHKYNIKGAPNELVSASEYTGNHFCEDYYMPGEVMNNPDLVRSAEAFELAKAQYRKSRRRIVNLNPDSGLDVFPKESWRKW